MCFLFSPGIFLVVPRSQSLVFTPFSPSLCFCLTPACPLRVSVCVCLGMVLQSLSQQTNQGFSAHLQSSLAVLKPRLCISFFCSLHGTHAMANFERLSLGFLFLLPDYSLTPVFFSQRRISQSICLVKFCPAYTLNSSLPVRGNC